MSKIAVGQRCLANDALGTVKFLGTTQFSSGIWVGVELDKALGKNDGAVQGVRYFRCAEKAGVFVRESKITPVEPGIALVAANQSNSITPSAAPNQDFKMPGPIRVEPPKTPSRLSRPVSRASIVSSTTTEIIPKSPGILNRPQRRQSAFPGTSEVVVQQLPKSSTTRQSLSTMVRTNSGANKAPGFLSTRNETASGSASVPHREESVARSEHAISPRPITERLDQPQQSSPHRTASSEAAPTKEIVIKDEEKQSSASLKLNEFADNLPVTGMDSQIDHTQSSDSDHVPAEREAVEVNQGVGTRQVEELRTRLKTLESQRTDDARKLSLLGALESEKTAWVNIRSKLREKLQAQQLEIKTLKGRVKFLEQDIATREATLKNSTEEVQSGDPTEMLEMAMLDREMAEEERDQLKLEVVELQANIEELSLELEILKEQEELDSTNEGQSPSDGRALAIQNDRLKEALIRLKEITQEQDKTIADINEECERSNADLIALRSRFDLVKGQLDDMEALVEDLKAQVDIAFGAEEMLETLTDRNLVLGEQLEKCRAEIVDLEALRELSEEMEENHIQDQKELTEQLKLQNAIVTEQTTRIVNAEEELSEYTATIDRFRELVKSQQTELAEMKQFGLTSEARNTEMSQQAQILLSQNTTLRTNEHKTAIRTLDNDLRQIEAASAFEHIEILHEYLPEAYEGDKASVEAYLTAKQASSISKALYEALRRQTGPASFEDMLIGAQICHRLMTISIKLAAMAETLKSATAKEFGSLRDTASDVTSLYKTIRSRVTSFQNNSLRDIETLETLERSLLVIQHMEERRAPSTNSVSYLSMQSWFIEQNLELANSLLRAPAVQSEITLTGVRDDLDGFVLAEAEITALRKSLKEGVSVAKGLAQDILGLSTLTGVRARLKALMDSSIDDTISMFSLAQSFASIFHTPVDAFASAFTSQVGLFRTALQQLNDTIHTSRAELSNKHDQDQETLLVTPPWKLRGQELGQLMHIDNETTDRLSRAQNDLKDIIIQLHQKNETLEEERLKSLALERRVHEQDRVSASAESMKVLEEKHNADKKAYDEALGELSDQIESLEEQLRNQRPISGGGNKVVTTMDEAAESEVATLRKTVGYLNAQLAQARSSSRATELAFLSKPLVEFIPEKDPSNVKLHKSLRGFIKELRFVDFAKTPPAQIKWTRKSEKCGFLHFTQEEEYARLLGMKRAILERQR